MAKSKPLGLGLIGCGAFGRFCLSAFSQLREVRAAAVADVVKPAADSAAKDFRLPAHYDPAELIARDDVQLVHIATPPSTHYELVLAAARAGKHVLCEKPLATNVAQADEMLSAARAAGVIAPVNFVLRYNAVTEAVKAAIDSGVLGRVLAARLTNCAADSNLPPGHWFWNKEISGGIFVEHGAHFFDLYRYWLGDDEVIDANTETREGTRQAPRPGSGQEDRVMCTVRHAGGAVVSHYHGFDQAGPMDRTGHRLVCELGDIRVAGWIPLTMTIDAAVDDAGAEKLAACCPKAKIKTVEKYERAVGEVSSRGVRRRLTQRIALSFTPNADKQGVYIDSVRSLLADQIAFIRDGSHARVITESNGRDALALAEAAVKLAARGR